VDLDLTLNGLRMIYEMNRGEQGSGAREQGTGIRG
jgi:hypothetical protein